MVPCVTCVSRWMKSIFARLSNLLSRLMRIRELSFGSWQGELKHGAAGFVRLRPQFASMCMDDGSADRQPHARSTGLGGVEGLEDSIEMLRINARSGIAHCDEDACLILLCADQKLSRPLLNRAHCFSRIQDEVQHDLL